MKRVRQNDAKLYERYPQKAIEGAKIRRESEFDMLNASNFGPFKDFRARKSEPSEMAHLRKKTRDQYFERKLDRN